MTENNRPEYYGRILQVYAALVASVVLSFVPYGNVELVGFVLFFAAWIAAYVFRTRNKDEESLVNNHMTYIIRTVWIASLLLSLGFVFWLAWFYAAADHSAYQLMINQILQGAQVNEAEVEETLQGYIQANLLLLIMISTLTLGPGLFYFIYRMANGLSRAIKGYRIAKPKGWF